MQAGDFVDFFPDAPDVGARGEFAVVDALGCVPANRPLAAAGGLGVRGRCKS